MKRTAEITERVMRPAFGCARAGDGRSQLGLPATRLSGSHVRPAYLSNVSRGSAVV